jgi:hypothetical protein
MRRTTAVAISASGLSTMEPKAKMPTLITGIISLEKTTGTTAGRWMTTRPEGEREGTTERDADDHVVQRSYELALRMLDRDAEILDQMRTRSSFLLAALALGGTLLSAILSSASRPTPPWWVLIWLGLALLPCLAVLLPTRDHGHLTQGWSPGVRESADLEARDFRQRWAQCLHARKDNERLWKIGINERDVNRAKKRVKDGGKGLDQELTDTMWLAHKRNDLTLTRRADLLRAASVLVLAFFIAFSCWL